MKPQLVGIFLCFLRFASSEIEIVKLDNGTRDLAKAVNKVISKVFAYRYVTANIIPSTKNLKEFALRDFMDELLTQKMESSSAEPLLRINSRDKLIMVENKPKVCSVILIDSLDDFKEFSTHIDPKTFLFRGFFLIVLMKGKINEMQEIFKIFLTLQILNVNIAYRDSSGEIQVSTFYPYSVNNCSNTTAVKINEFKNGKFENYKNFYPNKIRDMKGCTLRVATAKNVEPFVFAKRLINGSYMLSGRDITLLECLANKLNFKINYSFIGDVGSLLDNGTSFGCIHELMENRADLIIADFWLNIKRLSLMDATFPYVSEILVFIIPPGESYTNFEKMIRPFSFIIWMLISICLIVGLVAIIITKRQSIEVRDFFFGVKVKEPILNLIRIIFGVAQTVQPHRNFSRFLLMNSLLLFLIIRTLYQASLYQILNSDDHNKIVQSIDEMIEKDFKFYASLGTVDVLTSYSSLENRVIAADTAMKRNILKIIRRDPLFKGTVSESMTSALYFNQIHHDQPEINKICKQKFKTLQVVILMKKESFVIGALNIYIELLKSAGLIEYWHSKILDLKYRDISNSKRPHVLTLQQLSGSFNLLICGHLIAILSFIINFAVRHFSKSS